MGHARSTHRHLARVPDDEPRVVSRMIERATTHGRYGYPTDHGALLRGEGWTVHHKRVERLWCDDVRELRRVVEERLPPPPGE